VLEVLVVRVDRVASVATGPPLFPLREDLDNPDSAIGRTTRHIAVAHLIQTGQRQIGLEVALAAIRLPNARPVPGNRFLDKVAGSPALPRVAVWATLQGMQVWAAGQAALVARIAPVAPDLVRAEPIA
jgi:hypothetical protein